ncbi:MAG: L,D-transpeptidase family protein [Rhizobiaceae bacterium]|nr:L,D-transpeptidase family protein [Rhizobiaceae bacterium]
MTGLKKLARILLCSSLCIGGANIVGEMGHFNLVSQAEARQKTLFETLFPKAAARRRARELALQKGNEVEIKRVSAPRYYHYKPEALQIINFAPLSAKLTPPMANPIDTGDAKPENMHTGSVVRKTSDTTVVKMDLAKAEDMPKTEIVKTELAIAEMAEPAVTRIGNMVITSTEGSQPSETSESPMLELAIETTPSTPVAMPNAPVAEMPSEKMMVVDKALNFADYLDALANVEVRASAAIRKALLDHYTTTPEFMWLDGNMMPNEKAKGVLEVLQNAELEGLDPLSYVVRAPDGSTQGDLRLEDAATFEILLTARAMRYAADSAHGAVNPNKLSGYHDFPANKPNYTKILAGLSSADQPDDHLASYQPKVPAYEQFKQELVALRGSNDPEEQIVIKSGTLLKPGQINDQLPNIIAAIKKRASKNLMTLHEPALTGYSEGDVYTPDLVKLVKAFQRENKLFADGIVGSATIAKLSGISSQDKINRVLFAIERLRWHPSELGTRHVFINQPAYRATYMVNDKPSLSMRAIVGKASNQTSFFHDIIESVVYNPYWGVPRSILVNEMLPKLRENPSYLDERGYEVTDSKGRQVASASVDWSQVGSNSRYDVRQTPGPRNALGELKILFPNKHAIYMHDTPSRGLFRRTSRALSHGCVRLQQPRAMAAAVLGTSVSKITSMLGKGHSKQLVPVQIPVYVAYFTAWPKEDGEVQYFRDIYKRDRALAKAIFATAESRQAGV